MTSMKITTGYSIHIDFEDEKIMNHLAIDDLLEYLKEEKIAYNVERFRVREKNVTVEDGHEYIDYKWIRKHICHIGIYMHEGEDSETERVIKVLKNLVVKCEYKKIDINKKIEKKEVFAEKSENEKLFDKPKEEIPF